MDKKNSVMDNLHRLEYRPASVNMRDKQEHGHSENFAEVGKKSDGEILDLKKAAPSLSLKHTSGDQSRHEQPVVAPAVEFPPPEPPAEQKKTVSNEVPQNLEEIISEDHSRMSSRLMESRLNEAMNRRIADYRMSRHDLAVRVTEAVAGIERDQQKMEQSLSRLSSVYRQLADLEAELKKSCPLSEEDTDKQSLVGEESRKLEEMRLNAIRLIAGIETDAPEQHNSIGERMLLPDNSFDLDSLRFSQILRIGMGLSLPLLITILLSSLLIAASIICAFNGAIRW